MDADSLRLLLLIVGALLLLALYLFERRRATARSSGATRVRRHAGRAPAGRHPQPRRREPRFELDPDPDAAESWDAGAERDPEPGDAGVAANPGAPGRGGEAETRSEPAPAAEEPEAEEVQSGTEAPRGADRAASSAAAHEPLIVQLFVTAREQPFSGSAVQRAAERQQLTPGEMSIYHRRAVDGARGGAGFSMANLVKPGTFPFADMSAFSSPGLALFAQFQGMPSDLLVLDEMIYAAREIAAELGGDVRRFDREPLDEQWVQSLRERTLALLGDGGGSEGAAAGTRPDTGAEPTLGTGDEGPGGGDAVTDDPGRPPPAGS